MSHISSVIDVNASNWEKEVLQHENLVVVDFWHERCSWCNVLKPIYAEIATEYKGKAKFAKLNVLVSPENRHIAVKYGIMGTPTLVFFCGGKPVGSMAGFRPKESLKQLVDDALAKYRECAEKSTELKL